VIVQKYHHKSTEKYLSSVVRYNYPMIYEKIKEDVITALKAGYKQKASFLRVLASEMQMGIIAAKTNATEFGEDDEIAILTKEVKRRNEATALYEKAGEVQRVEKEQFEILIIKKYLPQQMSPEELEKIVSEVVAAMDAPDFGSVMKQVMLTVKGKADGNLVSEVVKKTLG